MSDVHGNLSALRAVITKAKTYNINSCILLGDIIDYGPHSNEVIDILKKLPYTIICNIWGNHEEAVINEHYNNFSSERGKICAKHTKNNLTPTSVKYIKETMTNRGKFEFDCDGKKCLAIHGSLEDEYWISLNVTTDVTEYKKYDYVFSGHSHFPHFFEKYYKTDVSQKRNNSKTVFINPGSVGQPRNLNNMAQFAILNIKEETVFIEKTFYDIKNEQKYFSEQVDSFYKERLRLGI